MTIQPVAQGASMPLWRPDEEILAVNLNLRERRYGGFYVEDSIGFSTSLPVVNSALPGSLWGSGTYGFMSYGSVAGAGLVFDEIELDDFTPTITQVSPFSTYGLGTYGFMSYGSGFYLDEIEFEDQTPTVTYGIIDTIYGSPTYAFTEYGIGDPIVDTITFSDASVTALTTILTTNVYGTGEKYGFCIWQ